MSARGFTMIELLVAIVAGMLVTLGAFAFAKASTRSFQQEARIANATNSVTMGMRRLTNDIQRASFLSTPNIRREYNLTSTKVCLDPGAAPPAIRDLTGIQVEEGGSYPFSGTVNPTSVLNGTSPDRLLLSGSYDSGEQFWARNVATNGATTTIVLEQMSGAVTRLVGSPPVSAPFTELFVLGRIVRIQDGKGFQHFGVIQSSSMPGNVPTIVLGNLPSIYIQGNVAPVAKQQLCTGMDPLGVGVLVNVVNRIRYEVRDLRNDPAYNTIYQTAEPVPEDAGRLELVRTEIDASGVPMGSNEVISEYAVDLKFGVTVDSGAWTAGQVPQPNLLMLDVGAASVYTGNWLKPASTLPLVPGAERVKSVRVRLSVRSREADRDATVPPSTTLSGLNGGIYRFRIGNKFARVRNLQADVALLNQQGLAF